MLSATAANDLNNFQTFDFVNTTAYTQYRLNILSSYFGNIGVRELELWENPTTQISTVSGTATATGNSGPGSPTQAFDGSVVDPDYWVHKGVKSLIDYRLFQLNPSSC